MSTVLDKVEENPTQKLEQAQKKIEEYIANAVKIIKAQEDKLYHELLESAHDNDQTLNSQLDILEDMLEKLENDPKSFLVGFSKVKSNLDSYQNSDSDQDSDQELDENSDQDFENSPLVSRGGKHA